MPNGSMQLMDSVHSRADVSSKRPRESHPWKGAHTPLRRHPLKHHRQWGRLHEQGTKARHKAQAIGYKSHCNPNPESEVMTSVVVTPGDACDDHQLPALLQPDLALGVSVTTVAVDRAHDDGRNHFLLPCQRSLSAMCLDCYRAKKKDPREEVD